jgi:hypothetical protein
MGYFEGIDSERGVAWRLADSLGLRRFLGVGVGGVHTGSLDDIADAAIDRPGYASRSTRLGAEHAGGPWLVKEL